MRFKLRFWNLLLASILVFTAFMGGKSPVQTVQAFSTDSDVFINEIHYDDSTSTGDINEGVEIAGPAGTDLTDWKIVLYNGNGGAPLYNYNFERHIDQFWKWIRFSFSKLPY